MTWRCIYIFLGVFNDATLGTLFYDFLIFFSLLHLFLDYVGLFFCNKLLFLMCHLRSFLEQVVNDTLHLIRDTHEASDYCVIKSSLLDPCFIHTAELLHEKIMLHNMSHLSWPCYHTIM